MHHRLNRRVMLGAAAALALPALPVRGQSGGQGGGTPISISLAPFLSPNALLAAFRPLREHLERTLRAPVEMLSARDFRSQAESVRAGQQDAAMMPAHVARLAMIDWKHELLAATLDALRVQVLVRQDSPVQRPAELRGQRIGMGDALSLTATVGRQWLREQGLGDGVEVVTMPSVNSALHALDRRELAMAIAGESQLAALPPETPRSYRMLASIGAIPGPMYVAQPGLPEARREALRAALLSFAPDPARPTTASNARLHLPDAALLARLDPLAAIARQVLASG